VGRREKLLSDSREKVPPRAMCSLASVVLCSRKTGAPRIRSLRAIPLPPAAACKTTNNAPSKEGVLAFLKREKEVRGEKNRKVWGYY